MFNTLINFFKDNKYQISINEEFIHILNYSKILDINETLVLLKLNDRIIKINGKNFVIKKLDKKELLITGSLERLDINVS